MEPKPINFTGLISDFFSHAITLELPLLKTCKELTLRPGHFVREYVEGKRKYKYRPVQFYLLGLTIYYLALFYMIRHGLIITEDLDADGAGITEEQLAQFKGVIDLFEDYTKWLMALQIPLFAFILWLFFRKHRYNFWEYVTLVLYASGAMLLASTITTLLGLVLPEIVNSILGVVTGLGTIVYNVWVFRQFHQSNSAGTIFRGIGALLVNMVLFTIATALIVFLLLKSGLITLPA